MAEAVPLLVVGIDHHRTPLTLRERIALDDSDRAGVEAALARLPGCHGAIVLATCNRLECWCAGTPDPVAVAGAVAVRRGLDPGQVSAWIYAHAGAEAVRHLLRVACGLESAVVGEAQIQGQVRDAYERARTAHPSLPGVLHQAFQRAIAGGKQVRTRTALGRVRVSTASVAVDLARQVIGDLAGAGLLVVGAGEIAEELLAVLRTAGVARISVVNRTRERADALAKAHAATAHDWQHLDRLLGEHDVIVCSTASPLPVIRAGAVRAAMRRRRRSLVLIDLAVPRDVDAEAGAIDDVYLYTIDHLGTVAAANRQIDDAELAQAAGLCDQLAAEATAALVPGRQTAPAAVAAWFAALEEAEWDRLRRDLPEAHHAAARAALHRLAAKLQHRVQERLRKGDGRGEEEVGELLGL